MGQDLPLRGLVRHATCAAELNSPATSIIGAFHQVDGPSLHNGKLHYLSQNWSEVDVAVSVLGKRGLSLEPAGPDNKGGYIEDPDGNAIYLSQP